MWRTSDPGPVPSAIGPNNELANIPYVALDACPETEEEALEQRREFGFPHPGSVAFDPTLGKSGVIAEALQPDPPRSLGTSETDDKGTAEPEEASRDVAREQRAAPTKPKRPAAVDGPTTSIAGTYSVQGRNPNGATYSGTLRVSRIDGDI